MRHNCEQGRHRALRSHHSRFSRLLARVAAVFVLTAVAFTGFTGFGSLTGTASATNSATAYSTNSADCAGVDPGAYVGACIALPSGGQSWLGSYKDSVDGRLFICIDYLYNSRLATYSTGTASGLINKIGGTIPDTSVRAMSYLDSKYAPAGSSGDPTTDAAIAYVARAVMGDGYISSTPLAITSALPDTSWRLPALIYSRAQRLWDEARTSFGPYTLSLTGLPAVGVAGKTYNATATVVSSAAAMGGAHPMGGVVITTATSGQLRVIAGNGAVTNSLGQVRIRVLATAKGRGTLTAASTSLPGIYANLEIPTGWRTNAADDTVGQRGLIATTANAAARANQTIARIDPAPVQPRPASPSSPAVAHQASGMPYDPDGDGGGASDTDDLPPSHPHYVSNHPRTVLVPGSANRVTGKPKAPRNRRTRTENGLWSLICRETVIAPATCITDGLDAAHKGGNLAVGLSKINAAKLKAFERAIAREPTRVPKTGLWNWLSARARASDRFNADHPAWKWFVGLSENHYLKWGGRLLAGAAFLLTLFGDRFGKEHRTWFDSIGDATFSTVGGMGAGAAGAWGAAVLGAALLPGAAPVVLALVAGIAIGYLGARAGSLAWDRAVRPLLTGVGHAMAKVGRVGAHAVAQAGHWVRHASHSVARWTVHAYRNVVRWTGHTLRTVGKWCRRKIVVSVLRAARRIISPVIGRLYWVGRQVSDRLSNAANTGRRIIQGIGHSVASIRRAIGGSVSAIGRGAAHLSSDAWHAISSWL